MLGQALTGRFLRGAQVEGVVSGAHSDAVDRTAAVSDDPQAGRLPTVPQTGSAVPGAGHHVPPPIHDGSVQNTCVETKAVLIKTQKAPGFPS